MGFMSTNAPRKIGHSKFMATNATADELEDEDVVDVIDNDKGDSPADSDNTTDAITVTEVTKEMLEEMLESNMRDEALEIYTSKLEEGKSPYYNGNTEWYVRKIAEIDGIELN